MSCSSYDDGTNDSFVVEDKNPNPMNCQIKGSIKIGRFLIVEVEYPNEGNKIMVYENMTIEKLNDIKVLVGLDPHFSKERPERSPVARFVPTIRGWDMARSFCNAI